MMNAAIEDSPSWRAWLVPVALLLASLVLVTWLDFRPVQAQPVLAVFSPTTSGRQALQAAAAAGGRVLGLGVFANAVVVQSDDPDFFARLHRAGAWFIADAVGRAGCGTRFKRQP